MNIYWFKLRAYSFYYLAKIFSKIFALEIPPLPSSCALVVNKNKILVIDLSYEKGYALPGGGLHPGENFEDALKRELKEETGLDAIKIDYLGSFNGNFRRKNHVSVTFLVRTKGKIKSSNEGTPKWVGVDEAIKNMVYEDNLKTLSYYKAQYEKKN